MSKLKCTNIIKTTIYFRHIFFLYCYINSFARSTYLPFPPAFQWDPEVLLLLASLHVPGHLSLRVFPECLVPLYLPVNRANQSSLDLLFHREGPLSLSHRLCPVCRDVLHVLRPPGGQLALLDPKIKSNPKHIV